MFDYQSAVYPGTFDPFTIGHQNLVLRASRLFKRVIVAVAGSESRKQPMIPHADRLSLLQQLFENEPGIEVVSLSGLLVDWMREHAVGTCVRGLRNVNDFVDEFQQLGMNRLQCPEIETIWLPASESDQMIASRYVREIWALGGDVSQFLPPVMTAYLETAKTIQAGGQ